MTNSNPPNNSPPDPNDPATFTGNSGVAAIPTPAANTGAPTTYTGSPTTNTGIPIPVMGSLGTWYIWTTVPTPNTQWIISGSTDPQSTDAKTEPTKQQKVKRGNEEGYECSKCKAFNAYADLNMPKDEPTNYVCYACRTE
jgi:hypothetical protein